MPYIQTNQTILIVHYIINSYDYPDLLKWVCLSRVEICFDCSFLCACQHMPSHILQGWDFGMNASSQPVSLLPQNVMGKMPASMVIE
jgi:hypothetical protein